MSALSGESPKSSVASGFIVDPEIRLESGRNDAADLNDISTSLIQQSSLGALYDRMLDAAIGLMGSDMASMQLFDAERSGLELLAWRGFHPASAAFWQWVHVDSASTCGMALVAKCRVVVPDIESCPLLADTEDLEEYRRSGIRAVQSTPLVSLSGNLVGMISTHWRQTHQPRERDLRQLDVLARQAAELVERGRVESALRKSEERSRWLASIVESSDDAIISQDLDGLITSWNRGAQRIFGYDASEVLGKPTTILIPPERHDEERAMLDCVKGGEHFAQYETVRLRKDARLIPVSLTASPIKDSEGNVVGASKIARDITERKHREHEVAVLAREAEHRTRNILATVQATVELSRSGSAEELKRAIAGRIEALAKVHALFVESRWAGAELGIIAHQELAPFCRPGDGRAHVAGPHVLLEPKAAQTIALVLHELATNAVKYGALSHRNGRIEVGWAFAAEGRLVLRWRELGGPPVRPPGRSGFGTTVMEEIVSRQLNGQMRLDWRPDGLSCEIAFNA